MAIERFSINIFSKLWSWFRASGQPVAGRGECARPSSQIVFRGTDLYGNNYFETSDKFGRPMRFVEPKEMKALDLPMIPEILISPEWLRWLRRNRNDPPTEEEMVRNAAIAYLKKQRAAELESEERNNWPELDAKLKQLEAENNYHPISLFPLYRDLMITPGQEYMIGKGFYVPDLDENQLHQIESQPPNRIASGIEDHSINQDNFRQTLESINPDEFQPDIESKPNN